MCDIVALDTDETQQGEGDETEAAVGALLESRKLSLFMERVALKSEQENIFRLVEEEVLPASGGEGSKRAPPSQSLCVTVTRHAGDGKEVGGAQAGGLVALDPCQGVVEEDAELMESQLWKWNKATGEMIPFASLDAPRHRKTLGTEFKTGKSNLKAAHAEISPPQHPFCLTAGWPYLNAVSFLTPNEQTVVTVMNEYPTDTYVLLRDKKKGSMWTALNGKSIQTITF